ncbi:hypothetical protein [Maricaulis maris]|uniref:DUF2125 domain-containing protein n=1 Tax=Maricaulis maris TaxID=74318 RepID=A0A495D402_9PROT|nr:hypothetical protein [Maricaulis maris]RKQ96637.1 hypothetical protein C7435_1969 [Maricaulis maris]
MRYSLLSAAAAASVVAFMLPAGSVEAQSRAAAEAAMARMGLDGTNESVSYASADFRGGRYILNDVTFSDFGDGGDSDGPDEIRAERMVFDALRLSDAGEVLFDGFALEGISATDETDDMVMRLDRIAIDGPNAAMTTDFGRAVAGEADEDYEPAWNTYEFAGFSVEGLSGSGSGETGPFEFSLAQFVIENYSRIELGRFAMLGLAFSGSDESGEPVTFNMGEVSLLGFQTEAYADMIDAAAAGADESAVMEAYYQSAVFAPLDLYDRFAMRDILVDAAGVHFSMDYLTAAMDRQGSRITSTAELGSAMLIPDPSKPAGAQLAMGLGMLGYEQLELRMVASSIYDEDTGRAYTTGDNYIELTDGLRLEMGQDISGYDAYLANLPVAMEALRESEGAEGPEMDAVVQLMAPLLVNNLSMRIVDLSILDRALDAGAAVQGISKDDLRIQAGAMVGMGLMQAPPEIPRPVLAEFSTALTNFINQGGSLTIDMTPPAPLSIGGMLQDIETGTFEFEALGLSFTSDAP